MMIDGHGRIDPPLGLQLSLAVRIMLPFIALHLAVSVVAGTAVIWAVSRAAESALTGQAERAATVLAESRFALHGQFLEHVKAVTGAEVLVFRTGGRMIAGTLEAAQIDEIAPRLSARDASIIEIDGRSFQLARNVFAPDGQESDIQIALLLPTDQQQELVRTAMLAVSGTALVGLLAVMLMGWWIARGITAPVRELSRSARAVTEGADLWEVPVTRRDEVGELATSFNRMVVELRQAQDELARTERLATAGRIAASLAHEIRNPLSSIRVLAELVNERAVLRPADQEALTTVTVEAERVERVVQNLLDLARPLPLRRELLQPRQLLTELARMIEPRLEHHGIRLSLEAPDDLEAFSADPDRLKQALLNLSLNAEEAMPDGGELKLRARRGADGMMVFLVEDNGIGIDRELSDRLCEPFVTSKENGVGLGLYVTARIAAEHGGRLSLAPNKQGGTVAQLELSSTTREGKTING